MKRKNAGKWKIIAISTMLALALTGCGAETTSSSVSTLASAVTGNTSTSSSSSVSSSSSSGTSVTATATTLNAMLDTTDMFSNKDLEQTADLTAAKYISLVSGQDVTITEDGVYVLSGNVKEVTVSVAAAEDAKVQLVLNGVTITNEDAPAIYVKTADKVFVTTTDTNNTMKVSGTFVADGDTNLDAVIYSKTDLVLNGTGTLEIISTQGNGITSKDDLKITGGTYNITSKLDGFEGNDSIRVYSGIITVTSNKDAFHSENAEDLSLGYIYIQGGTFIISAAEDAIQGISVIQIDGGEITITKCLEGIEATYIQINGGTIKINSSDDGINAAAKSSFYDVVIEINGGNVTIVMGSGDTDAVDANGSIYVNGGTITITAATSSFDFDDEGKLNGGTVTVNGAAVTEIVASMMGGGAGGKANWR